MRFLHRPKDRHARSTPLPTVPPPLFTETVRGANVGLSQLRGGGIDEQAARRKLGLLGYRLHSGGLYLIVNDDPEDFAETLIANWDGTAQDAWNALEVHGWPTSPFVVCPCGDGEAELGSLCVFCARESVEWEKAGEV